MPKDGEVLYFPQIFTTDESDQYFKTLLEETPWKQESIVIYGKEMMQPRLTAWYGDHDYKYSGLIMQAKPWTPTLLEIKKQVEAIANKNFNSALLNQYRNGNDSVGWHRDNEKELGINPVIASVSFGATRNFQFKHFTEKNLKAEIELTHGSLLLMRGETQHHWLHSIPKSKQAVGTRINITFRVII